MRLIVIFLCSGSARVEVLRWESQTARHTLVQSDFLPDDPVVHWVRNLLRIKKGNPKIPLLL